MRRIAADRLASGPVTAAAPRRVGETILAAGTMGNAVLITALALHHPVLARSTQPVLAEALYMTVFVFTQALVLLSPGWLIGAALAPRRPSAGTIVGGAWIALVPVCYYLDAAVHHVTGLRLFEWATWELALPVIGRLGEFTARTSLWAFVRPVGLYLVFEVMLVGLGSYLGRRWPGRLPRRLRLVPAVAGLSVAMPLALFAHLPDWSLARLLSTQLVSHQPLFMTRLFEQRAQYTDHVLEARWQTRLLTLDAELAAAEERYRRLALVDRPRRTPDIIAIVVESLRADAIDPRAAPHLADFSHRSLVGRNHFSAGNSTQLGYFGLLYGLDALWYARAVANGIPPGLNELLRQTGYHTAFVGSWSLDWKGMGHFLNERTFDTFLMFPLPKAYYEGDKAVVETALAIRQRRGAYEKLADTPLFVLVQINTTHWEYHSEAVDQVFQPIAGSDQLLWSNAEAALVHNRFRNSVHCMDRIIAPLLDDDAIVLIVGDHGQSFGEDGRFFHGTATSDVQSRTAFLLHIPGAEPRIIDQGTGHRDFLATVLDALGLEIRDPRALPGRSLLQPSADSATAPLMVGEGDGRFGLLRPLDASGRPASFGYSVAVDCWDASVGFGGPVTPLAQPAPGPMGVSSLENALQTLLALNLGVEIEAAPANPVPVLQALLADRANSPRVLRALEALDRLGSAARPAMAEVRSFLNDDRPAIRSAAFALVTKLARSGG